MGVLNNLFYDNSDLYDLSEYFQKLEIFSRNNNSFIESCFIYL